MCAAARKRRIIRIRLPVPNVATKAAQRVHIHHYQPTDEITTPTNRANKTPQINKRRMHEQAILDMGQTANYSNY